MSQLVVSLKLCSQPELRSWLALTGNALLLLQRAHWCLGSVMTSLVPMQACQQKDCLSKMPVCVTETTKAHMMQNGDCWEIFVLSLHAHMVICYCDCYRQHYDI